ncbi:MAG TPA: type II toxin-antitoxin system VapC family toxin [Gemmataceae bacterium]|nr:type II toxin-antitoxin system VapC family toxin [Gemmataceae bacterium]
MRYVLDVSAALCWVLPRPASPRAARLRDECLHGVQALIAPSIFPAEAASALTKAERQKLIPIGQAGTLLAAILTTPPVVHPYEPLLARAVDISSQSRSGLYDCLYVALAERERCELVTDDQKLIANLKPQFAFIVPLSSLP